MAESAFRGRLLRRLDEIAAVLARDGEVIALIGLGSVGVDLHRIDEHSDLDFHVVVEAWARQRYLDSIAWLEQASPVTFSFRNTPDGRKVLFADGIYAEYAVFDLDRLAACPSPAARLVWQRDDAPSWLGGARNLPESAADQAADWLANEALTNLYVGLHRDMRGERLSATRLIQVHALNGALRLAAQQADLPQQQDPFAIERGAEARFKGKLPLAAMAPGYDNNRDAALAILDWLERHIFTDPTIVAAIRELADSHESRFPKD